MRSTGKRVRREEITEDNPKLNESIWALRTSPNQTGLNKVKLTAEQHELKVNPENMRVGSERKLGNKNQSRILRG